MHGAERFARMDRLRPVDSGDDIAGKQGAAEPRRASAQDLSSVKWLPHSNIVHVEL